MMTQVICPYALIITVSDLVSNASQTFKLSVLNNAPYPNRPIYQGTNKLGPPLNYTLHVLDQLYYYFPDDSFVDIDKEDTLSFEAYAIQEDGSRSLPTWISFNQ